ncbi:FecR family protein [Hymenobacter psoromatis]|uniref:FecR family protein n=1 Tax=Hymenobacter psoromatis TaxID=1484116 RepID=UPI001CBDD4ED|nr:FecR domain-containing protein [Hymenobacter psoromatis]
MTPRYAADPPDAPWALLARHLAAEATAAERAELRAWVRADPAHLQILTTVTRAWERAGEATAGPVLFSPADVEAAWQRFRPLLQVPTAAPAKAPVPVVRPLWPGRRAWPAARWQLAAGLALLLGTAYALTAHFLVKPLTLTTTYASGLSRHLVHLPDGSLVWLNAHSRLRYTGGAAAGTRAAALTGEAYFEVTPNQAQPFVVSTAAARVRVTGTAFNVRAFAAEDSVEVSVTRGRVWLLHPAAADSVLLVAGTRATLRAADAPGRVATALRRSPLANTNFRAWQTDTLRFADTPVAQVTRALQATFGTTVALGSPALGQCRFTGTFVRPQPAQVLAVLAAATASRLTPDGHGGYQLQGPGCAPAALSPSAAEPARGSSRP